MQNERKLTLQEQVNYLKKKLFGTSSEKRSKELIGQLSFLFNEAEVLCDIVEFLPPEEKIEENPEDATSESKSKKPKRPGKTLEETLEGKPFTKKYVDLPEDQKVCPECGTPYTKAGEEYLRTEYNIIPPRIEIIKWYSITYRCPHCSGNGVVPELIKSKRLPVPYLPSGEMPYEPDFRRRSGKVGTLGSGSKADYW